jgi:hypothetical protein
MKKWFYICQECGAYLDPGEKCDCLETDEQLILPDLPVINKDASTSNLLKESEQERLRPTFFEPAKNWVVIDDHISREETNVKSKT